MFLVNNSRANKPNTSIRNFMIYFLIYLQHYKSTFLELYRASLVRMVLDIAEEKTDENMPEFPDEVDIILSGLPFPSDLKRTEDQRAKPGAEETETRRPSPHIPTDKETETKPGAESDKVMDSNIPTSKEVENNPPEKPIQLNAPQDPMDLEKDSLERTIELDQLQKDTQNQEDRGTLKMEGDFKLLDENQWKLMDDEKETKKENQFNISIQLEDTTDVEKNAQTETEVEKEKAGESLLKEDQFTVPVIVPAEIPKEVEKPVELAAAENYESVLGSSSDTDKIPPSPTNTNKSNVSL